MTDSINDQLLDEVTKFFVGPRNETDFIPEGNTPLDVYTSGILFPMSTPKEDLDNEHNDNGDEGVEDVPPEEESENFFKQNSIGLRSEIKKDTKKIQISVNYGKYLPNDSNVWVRHELDLSRQTHVLELSDAEGEIELVSSSNSVEAKIWWKLYDGTVLNIFLENPALWVEPDKKDLPKKESEKKDQIDYAEAMRQNNENSIFQPSITIRGLDDKHPFNPVSVSTKSFKTKEDDLFDMLYRHKKVFGGGYGCAAEWEEVDKPSYVKTTIIPTFQEDEIDKYAADENDPLKPARVDMFDLACFENLNDNKLNRKKIAKTLTPIVEKYRKWVIQQQKTAKSELDGSTYLDLANMNLDNCEHVLERIDDGLRLLTEESGPEGDRILKAFILANRAMLYQRLHFGYALSKFKNKNDRDWPDAKKPGQEFWHPFQIAFLLMSLRGIAFKQHPDNSIADLIWFPTGGGKTEAYLGVAAFTMILRRLKGDTENGLGVSVIMRYTLRLLTLQQFERASTLICALEYIRRKVSGSELGKDPFLLGLWVGYSLTPNHYQSSESALKQLHESPDVSPAEGSPCQANYCPWCGTRMYPDRNYKFDKKTHWTLIRCTNENRCIFSDRTYSPDSILPLVTVDSDIYTRCPSMLIATVDKFARLPFRTDIANIFGRPGRKCDLHGFLPREKHANCSINSEGVHTRSNNEPVRNLEAVFPPDLIIQDELHLISGPLGTMVGLYETAVDFLTRTTRDGKETRPKVIVSTATIKGAQEQVRKIFNRTKTQSFPPPGIDRKDSFFWWETGKKGKMFVGVSFSQRSGKFTLAKLYAALLQRAQIIRLSGTPDTKVDPYWTLVGYYNSIRELGGANRLVEDDVKDKMEFLSNTVYDNSHELRDPGTPENGIDELTGRKTQLEINIIRDKLEKALPDSDVISVLLATNMISTGIDINRLGLMAVNGQPKTVTEYIQAAGRIGRRADSPGSIFVLFNPYKPRDLSHYENFGGFHKNMQKHVEPSTLTPFSIPSYTRALHAVLIAMIRLSNTFLAEKTTAHNFTVDDGIEARKFILERFKSVEQVGEDSNAYKRFEKKLVTLMERWVLFSNDVFKNTSLHDPVWYNNPYDKWHDAEPKNPSVLMIEFAKRGVQESDEFPLSTPESLRDVEQQIEMEYV